LLAVGVGLAASGQLRRADDVFFLTLPELRAVAAGANLDARTLVRERRAEYDQELRRNHVPRLLLSDGTEPVIPHRDDLERRDVLRGTPASAGQVRGMARVVLDPVQAHLTPGDVLVAPSTDPGWTPLFLTAGGLVMEMGGAMSHGAVVAREYGIPAVVGVPGATSRIRNGQQVLVDGTAGTVSGLDGSREDTESEQLRSTESSSG
jgi:pyruvate,water dikinase